MTPNANTARGETLRNVNCSTAVDLLIILPCGILLWATSPRFVRCDWRWKIQSKMQSDRWPFNGSPRGVLKQLTLAPAVKSLTHRGRGASLTLMTRGCGDVPSTALLASSFKNSNALYREQLYRLNDRCSGAGNAGVYYNLTVSVFSFSIICRSGLLYQNVAVAPVFYGLQWLLKQNKGLLCRE